MPELTARERVESELKELDERTDKLGKFIFSVGFQKLDQTSQQLLQAQQAITLPCLRPQAP